MLETSKLQTDIDPVWTRILCEAEAMANKEPALSGFLHAMILNQPQLELAIACHLSEKLGHGEVTSRILVDFFQEAFLSDAQISDAMRTDIVAVFERDPACKNYLDVVLFFKGFLALQAYRAAHWLLEKERRGMALYIQSRSSEVLGADIHPNAKIGKAIMIDHATSVVIGETAHIGDNVSMLHDVTLGGNGKETGERHPKIGCGVLISAGAKILGNIHVGDCAKIGAGSVVLDDVPAYCTVVGIPAKIVGEMSSSEPAHTMDHVIRCFDEE